MSEALYERYKDALRRGHVAVLRDRLGDALEAYAEAAAIATERPLPHTAMAGVHLRLGHVQDALAAYDAALERAPRDEAALVGRAEALSRAGRASDAAASLDVAADVQADAGRLSEALDTARRALELAASNPRRRRVGELADRLRSASGLDQAAEQALARALRLLDAREPAAGDAAAADVRQPSADEADESAIQAGVGADSVEADGSGEDAVAVDAAARPARDDRGAEDGSSTAPAAVDPVALRAAADEAIDAGDVDAARAALLGAARAHAADGLHDAALDACHLALAIAPDDADIHLELVDLYLARGWRAPAAEKLLLLDRLLELDGADEERARVRAIVATAFADEPRLAALRS